jgi:hypothetical protein
MPWKWALSILEVYRAFSDDLDSSPSGEYGMTLARRKGQSAPPVLPDENHCRNRKIRLRCRGIPD